MSELLSLQMNVVAILSLLTSGLRWETVRMCARCTAYVCAVVVISQTLSRWGENSNQCPKRIMFKQYYDHLFHSIFLKLFFFFFFFPHLNQSLKITWVHTGGDQSGNVLLFTLKSVMVPVPFFILVTILMLILHQGAYWSVYYQPWSLRFREDGLVAHAVTSKLCKLTQHMGFKGQFLTNKQQ